MKARVGGPKYRHAPNGQPDTLTYRPRTHRLVRVGIKRRTGVQPLPPLSATQQEVLALLTDELQGVAALARTLGRTESSVTGTLYALAGRGLAERAPYRGWRLA